VATEAEVNLGAESEDRGASTIDAMSDPLLPLALTLVVITRDAAASLAECLNSARFASQIIVVDSGSSDNTAQIARDCGARVVEQPWLGFGPQKNFAVAQAANDWVLCLDADEIVSPELASSIQFALRSPEFTAYEMPRRNRFLGRWLAHGEGYPDRKVRLFDRRHARWSDDVVHERVHAEGSIGRLNGDLLHASAESLEAYLAKQNRYTTLQAERLFARGARFSAVRLVASPIARLVRFYIIRGGFLDGVAGLVHISIGCFNSFSKYAKLRALEQADKNRHS
jgi:glycosyltransferase involved in cell wall biosynthesis